MPAPIVAALALAISAPVFAAEDDDLGLDAEEETEPSAPRAASGDEDEGDLEEDPEGDEDWTAPVHPESSEELRFDDEEDEDAPEVEVQGPGQDTSRIYRQALEDVRGLDAAEEALFWERYLRKYPNSVFRGRIEQRLDELQADLFEEHVEDTYSHTEEAGRAEIGFMTPVALEPLDPRSRLRAGFVMGFPAYLALDAEVEWQLWRELSVHGGARGRYEGTNLEAGARWAVVKSARTKTLVTLTGDVHIGTNPVRPGFRPTVAFGQRLGPWGSADTTLDVAVQLGADLVISTNDAGDAVFSPRELAGLGFELRPSPTVRVFAEATAYAKDLGDEELDAPFHFEVFTFGLKFVGRKNIREDRYEVGVSANAPFAWDYWSFHTGAVGTQVNYFL